MSFHSFNCFANGPIKLAHCKKKKKKKQQNVGLVRHSQLINMKHTKYPRIRYLLVCNTSSDFFKFLFIFHQIGNSAQHNPPSKQTIGTHYLVLQLFTHVQGILLGCLAGLLEGFRAIAT
jgi:hypothetical protein